MTRCTRKGCGQEYDPENAANSCTYHPGGPVFHEGLKSWSCCADVNKPVLEFDEFMKINGCAKGDHTDKVPQVEAPKPSSNMDLMMTNSSAGTEVYTSMPVPSGGSKCVSAAVSPPAAPTPVAEEEEDINVPVSVGTICLHNGCGTAFLSDEVNRNEDGEGTICTYHPAPPIFREGSKGYLCCKRRVLEFDEFLKIQGCKIGRHLFARKAAVLMTEENITCRTDHYQTLTEVHVSIFAKQTDQNRSVIKFAENEVFFDLYLPGSKRFTRTLDLFGPIDASKSTLKFFGTKVELHLKKLDNRSWTVLEKTTQDLGNITLTFGVGGRTGTIGGKEIVLDDATRVRG